jgi:dihydroxyacetone kinase-like predicted kinase
VLDQMCLDMCELITLYYGNNVQEPDARVLADELSERYADLEFELVFGGQPHYHYIMSAE